MHPVRDELQLLQIFMILSSKSRTNYLVGGCVRDHLLGIPPNDWDIVTDIPMGEVKSLFEPEGWAVKETGKQFLVLSISKDGNQYEISNFRKDLGGSDGRHPGTVEVGTIEEDAQRRDFTVNALYLDPRDGIILDPTGKGLEDLRTKTLRFIGKPDDRIKEDFLRVFRFYRFIKRGFVPHPRSLRACREWFNEAYARTTPERVRNEIEKMIGLV